MSEFKGVKGKWEQSHRQIPNDINGNWATQVYSEDGETIASIAWYPNPQENRVMGTYREANAKLISCAPEMLDILSKILMNINWSYESWISNDGLTIKEEIEQLIKKATE